MLDALRSSGLDWTVVLAPVLTATPLADVCRIGWVGVNASPKIGRASGRCRMDVLFFVSQAEQSTVGRLAEAL